MKNDCADEASADYLNALSQLAVLLFNLFHVEADQIIEEKNDQDCLAKGRDEDVNKDFCPPQVALLVNHEHFGFPFGMALLILIYMIVVDVMILLVLKMIQLLKLAVLHDFHGASNRLEQFHCRFGA